MKRISERIQRIIFTIFGTLFLILGAIGVFIPVLPTTPFLLLAAACYLRGSERMHRCMINNRVFGDFIRNYMEGRGISPRQKLIIIIFLWVMIIISIYYLIDVFLLRILVLFVAIVISAHIIMLPSLQV